MDGELTPLEPTTPDNYMEHHPHSEDGLELPRSSQWPKVRNAYLLGNPCCAACGTVYDLNVHHVISFHEHPDKELDPTNLITLCREHHLHVGHRCPEGNCNWSCSNVNVREEVYRMQQC